MATWHQTKAHGVAMANLYQPPATGHKIVVNHPNALAYTMHFSRKRKAERFAKRTGGTIISAVKKPAPEPLTPVLFRFDKHGKNRECTAVFPTLPAAYDGSTMVCYAHLGQHSGCSRDWYATTRPATVAEYADLKRELESAPFNYRLKVYQRMTAGHRAEFLAQLKSFK